MKSFVLVIILFFSFPLLALAGFTTNIVYSGGRIFISGKPARQQVFLDSHGITKQLTHFSTPNEIREILLSQDEKHLLVHYLPRNARAMHLSIMDMKTFKITRTIVPGYGDYLAWTKYNTILHVWGCGTGCSTFRIYDVRLKILAQGDAGVFFRFPNEGLGITSPGMFMNEGLFIVRSLADGSVVLDTAFTQKYGAYRCDDIKYIRGKFLVKLFLDRDSTTVNDSLIVN
jgi:hypothetical protein